MRKTTIIAAIIAVSTLAAPAAAQPAPAHSVPAGQADIQDRPGNSSGMEEANNTGESGGESTELAEARKKIQRLEQRIEKLQRRIDQLEDEGSAEQERVETSSDSPGLEENGARKAAAENVATDTARGNGSSQGSIKVSVNRTGNQTEANRTARTPENISHGPRSDDSQRPGFVPELLSGLFS